METVDTKQNKDSLPPVCNAEAAIRHFQSEIIAGKHWYMALLETIGLWTDEQENYGGRFFNYLIEQEAFDWLLLAERLCLEANGLIPEREKDDLLFRCIQPLDVSMEEFKDLIGQNKYHQLLNYFYGVTVEQALVQAVREEVRKERRANGWNYRRGEEEETFLRIYSEDESSLLKAFRHEHRHPPYAAGSLTEMKEFAYWCFKYRVKKCEKARVGSDTNKALEWLRRNGAGVIVRNR